jgi:hypothetical protein
VLVAAVMTLLTSVAATPATGAADPQARLLLTYLSSMSWPVRASLGRAESLGSAIDGFVSPGDTPYLGAIAASCRKLRAVEARGRLLRITAPPRLGAQHRRVAASYSKLRAGCIEVRRTALAVRAARDRFATTGAAADEAALQKIEAAARRSLPQFSRTTLRSFTQAVQAWRASVLRNAAILGIAPPAWVKALPSGP